MRVRVYDKENKTYFKSEVYAIIDGGWYARYLVLEPYNDKLYLKLIEYIDKSHNDPYYPVNINVITNEMPDEWVIKKDADLLQIRNLLSDQEELRFDFQGFPWLFEESKLVADLIRGNKVDCEETPLKAKNMISKKAGWQYVENETDIHGLLYAFYDFHDSCLTSLQYISGSKVLEDRSMIPFDGIRQVTMSFESQCCNPIELVFEGVLAMNLRPARDNRDSIINCASIILKDEAIFFCDCEMKTEELSCDDEMETEELSYEDTWIKALSLRWRQLN